MTTPILRWPGGKRRMLKHILPLIPKHTCYCETFAGGLAVLMAKERSSVEVVNDQNGDLIALYRNLQFHLPAVMEELSWLAASRQNLKEFSAQPGLTELQRVSRFLLLNRISFGGQMRSFGVAKTAGGGVGFKHSKVNELLGAAHERLDGVVIEQSSYERCMKNYDSKDTFFFCDPPYLHSDTENYDGFTREQMTEFRDRIDRLKGQWVVTVDDSSFNRDLFKHCKLQAVTTRSGIANNRTANATFGELLITKS